jgi:hypothetical protein
MPRPRLKPNDEQRRLVKSLAAMGTPQEHIALKIGIRSPKTLRKYFKEQLDFGMVDATIKVKQTLFQMATSGKSFAATQFWLKTHNRSLSGGEGANPPAPPPFIIARETGDGSHG